MFDHSVAVIASISRNLKKYLNITSIITQLLFIGYYSYLIVVNVSNLKYLVAYSLICGFAFLLLIVDIVSTFRELDRKAKRMKARTKRIINYFSWIVKLTVIIFNAILIVNNEATEAARILLIFSGVFLLVQILLTLITTLFSYYLDLLLYGLKMDYEALIDSESSNSKPVGKLLNQVTKDINYKDEINELSIKHEVRGTIKHELEQEFPLKINNKVIKRKKAERIIIHYYNKANKYYLSAHKLEGLLARLKQEHITYLTSDDKLYVFLFFTNNHLTKNYKGMSEYALKLIIATLLFIVDGNDRSIIEVAFNAIRKELFDVNSWSEVIKEGKSKNEYYRVLDIVKEQKIIYKKNREETILSEFKDITIQEVTKNMDLPKPVNKLINYLVDRKKKK